MTIRTLAPRRASLALLAVLALPACAVFRKEVPLSPEQTYQRGMAAYQAESYRRAASLLGQWVQSAGGDPRMPQALLALGRSHMRTREHVTAAADFLRVVTDYPTSPEQREARFGICQAYQELSPRAQLDQEYTEAAITYCDSYAQYYGDTPEAADARRWVGELREKLAQKQYENGMFYFRRGGYDASVIYFNDAARLYPETRVAPAALLKIVEAYDRIGYAEEAAEARARLQREHPESPEARSLVASATPSAPPSPPPP